jgi:hypothetical protein
MKSKYLINLFFFLGIAFALTSIFLGLQPLSGSWYRVFKGGAATNNILSFASIATGVVSASCFMMVSLLTRKNSII